MSDYPPEWKECLLGEVVGKISSGGTPKADNQDLYGGEIPFLRIDDITSSSKYLTSHKTTINERGLSESSAKIIPAGTLLLTMYGTIGRCCITTYPVATNQAIASFLEHPEIAVEYLYYALEHKAREFTAVSSQTTQANISASVLKQTRIAVPPLPEQKKIAEILSGIDRELHTCHENLSKTNLLRASMLKNMMQDAEEDSIEQAFGSIVEVINGRAYKLTEWEREGTPVIRLQNLTKQGGHFYYSNLQLPEKQYCEKGDLLFMWSASFGPHIWWGEKAIYHYHIWKMVPKENSLLKDYLYLFLQYKTEEWKTQGAGMAMIHLTKEGIEKEAIPLPPVATQERIVNAIKSIDNRIEATKAKAKKFLLMKGALSSDLLSGRKRVTP